MSLTPTGQLAALNKLRVIHVTNDEEDLRQCWPVFRELRPHLQSEDEFIERWCAQCGEGYEIAFVKEGSRVVAAAGYRFLHTLAWGHILYLDDLVAAQTSYRTGLGTLLLRYVQNKARERGCNAVHMDTGYQRHLAHRAYVRNGFQMHCHHMVWRVD